MILHSHQKSALAARRRTHLRSRCSHKTGYAHGALCNTQPCGFGPEGYWSYRLAATLPLSALGQLHKISLTVVNPFDNSLWLGDDKTLVQLDGNGQLQRSLALPETMNRIVLALDHSLWAVGKHTLWHIDAEGRILSSQALPGKMDSPEVMVIDDLNGVLWLAKDKQLTQLELNQANGTPRQLNLPDNALGLAVNPLSGTLWVITEKTLLSYGADGQPGAVTDLNALGLKNILSVGFDPVTQVVLVSTQKSLTRLTAQGSVIATLAGKDSGGFAAPAFLMTPTVSLVRPPALTNNPTPTIAYAYGALCNTQPCGFVPTAYICTGYLMRVVSNRKTMRSDKGLAPLNSHSR